MTQKFNITVKQGEEFITVGNIRPNKSGKSWGLTIFADKTSLMQRSPCGRYINALVVEDKRTDFGGGSTSKHDHPTPGQPTQNSSGASNLQSDVPF